MRYPPIYVPPLCQPISLTQINNEKKTKGGEVGGQREKRVSAKKVSAKKKRGFHSSVPAISAPLPPDSGSLPLLPSRLPPRPGADGQKGGRRDREGARTPSPTLASHPPPALVLQRARSQHHTGQEEDRGNARSAQSQAPPSPMLIVFALDTSASTAARSVPGLSLLDCAKGAIEHFVKVCVDVCVVREKQGNARGRN